MVTPQPPMIDDKKLADWDALAKAATPGPWAAPNPWVGNDGGWAAVGPHHEPREVVIEHQVSEDPDEPAWGEQCLEDDEPGGPVAERAEADQRFINAARTAVPELCAEVRRLRADRERLRQKFLRMADRAERETGGQDTAIPGLLAAAEEIRLEDREA